MKIKELKDFIFPKENSYCSMEYQKKKGSLLFATKLKEKYLIFLFEGKNTKLVKQLKIITYQKDIVYIKSVIIEHLKNLHKLSNVIRQAEKFFTSERC